MDAAKTLRLGRELVGDSNAMTLTIGLKHNLIIVSNC